MDKSSCYVSNRLAFRGIRKEDAPLIVEWRGDPDNYRFFLNPHPITIEEHLAWFERYLEDEARYDFLILDENRTPIGVVGLSNITADSCEVNYIVGAKEARGRGFASEAVEAMTRIAFDELGVESVFARILVGYEASEHVVRKAGYEEFERVFRVSRG